MSAKNSLDGERKFDGDGGQPTDWQLPLACDENRHFGKIQGSSLCLQCWRMKERMKTVSVALVLCLNVGVDPPDVVKISPCARTECWIDPSTMSPQKALNSIGINLQKQYERWQPRARYRQSLDPTVDEVKKLCTSLRRNAKEERVLFHYIGHGVPRPTTNGEIWVFNKSYTQYIPLSLYDLQSWMGSPSIYVFDCSNAGIIIDLFKTFTTQREQEAAENSLYTRSQDRLKKNARFTELSRPRWVTNRGPSPGSETVGQINGEQSAPSSIKNSILLASCGANEFLPMNPDLPADLFTSCLTTPIKVALRWYVLQNSSLVPGLTMEMVDKLPGQLSERRTMLGELNWIFTAITDTIAWNSLPRDLFQKLFRQDLLVASLFRNFLLAERIMRSYNCVPISNPKLPPTYQHPMWQAWDLALDLCLQQLIRKPAVDGLSFTHSPFFAEQLTAFKVWLDYGSESRRPPEQLPIVLQVLLSQVHRVRALDLLGKFLDLGPWAVNLALSVGIFPYVLKLLQSSDKELRPLLVFIWAKILAVDPSCQADLVKDSGHKYFLSVLSEQSMSSEHRTMAAFVVAIIMNNYPQGREAALQDNTISKCLVQLSDSDPHLRQWLALCLAKVWTNFDNARWCGVRDRAHEKLSKLLFDPEPEVRAATVYALGTFISRSQDRTDQSVSVDVLVGNMLVTCVNDGSPLVRKELVVAFSGYVSVYIHHFVNVVKKILEERMERMSISLDAAGLQANSAAKENQKQIDSLPTTPIKRSASRGSFKTLTSSTPNQHFPSVVNSASSDNLCDERQPPLRRVSSSLGHGGQPFVTVYSSVWNALCDLSVDPYPEVSAMAKLITDAVERKARLKTRPRQVIQALVTQQNNHSIPSSPSNRPANMFVGTPPQTLGISPTGTASPFGISSRKLVDKMPSMFMLDEKEDDQTSITDLVSTQFFEWSCKYFQEPVMCLKKTEDPECSSYQEKHYRFLHNAKVRHVGQEQLKTGVNRLDMQVFVNKVGGVPTAIQFHPYQNYLAVADNFNVSFWDLEHGTKVSDIPNPSTEERAYNNQFRISRITSVNFINSHNNALFMYSTDDGAIRLYRNFLSPKESERTMVTAFKGLSEMVPSERGSGLVTEWEQESTTLITSGNARIIRLWDMQRETKLTDINTGAESCVTSLASDPLGKSLLIAGCGDGSVRLFDRRLAPSECRVMTLKEHDSWVLKVHLQRGTDGKIVSACYDGDIRFWDPRFTASVQTYSTPTTLSCVDIHPTAHVLACGSTNQCLTTYSPKGEELSVVKYHDGFLGQRIGNASCMTFHPHLIKLAVGSADAFISIYTTPSQRNAASS